MKNKTIFKMLMRAGFLTACLLPCCTFAKEAGKIKVFDKPGERAGCPSGYSEVGRFAELGKGAGSQARGGMECKQDAKANAKKPSQNAPKPPVGPDGNLPNELTLEEKDGQAPKCPDGYQQTGTFNNMTFANGKLDKKSGIYCMRLQQGNGGNNPESSGDAL